MFLLLPAIGILGGAVVFFAIGIVLGTIYVTYESIKEWKTTENKLKLIGLGFIYVIGSGVIVTIFYFTVLLPVLFIIGAIYVVFGVIINKELNAL